MESACVGEQTRMSPWSVGRRRAWQRKAGSDGSTTHRQCWQRQEVMGVPHTGFADKGRKWWEYHTQAVLTKVGSDEVPHTGSADKERQELIRPSRRGRPVDRISFCSNQGCVDRSRLQTHRRIRLVQNSDVFIPKSSSETQSVESHQSHPRVCWFKSSSDTVSGMWTVETRCILVQVVFWHSQWDVNSWNQVYTDPGRLLTQSMESHQFKSGARTLSGHLRHSHWSLSHRTKCRLDSAAPRPSRPIHRRSTGAWVSENKRGKRRRKTSLVYRDIMVYMDNTCLQRHNGLHGQYVSTET